MITIKAVKSVAFGMRHALRLTNCLANWTGKIAAPLKKVFTGKEYYYGNIRLRAYMYNYMRHPTGKQMSHVFKRAYERDMGYDNIVDLFPSGLTAHHLFGKGINRTSLDLLCHELIWKRKWHTKKWFG